MLRYARELLEDTALDVELRELAILRVAALWAQHTTGTARGDRSPDRIDQARIDGTQTGTGLSATTR